MNFIKNLLFGSGTAEENKDKDEFVESDLTKILSQDDFETIITTSLNAIQLCQFKPTSKGQTKETIFINSTLWLTTKEFQIEGQKNTVVVIQINNDEYDDSQEQEALKQLPLTKDLQFLSYTGYTDDGEEQVIGFVLIYHDYNISYAIEQVVESKDKNKEHEQRDAFEAFKTTICQILFALNEGKNFKDVPKKQYMQYCQVTTLDILLNSPNIIQQLKESADGQKNVQAQQKSVQVIHKKHEESKVKEVMDKMKSLDMMKEEIKNQDEIKIQIIQRLLQVKGDLYEYNPLEDANQIRVKDVFLCLDKTGNYQYILNIIDSEGKISYTRKSITNLSDFQLDQATQGVCFIGTPRKNGYIPGYFFRVPAQVDFQNLKGSLAKCVFESQNKQSYEKQTQEEGDQEYFQQQLEGNFAKEDINMKEVDDEIDDYEYFNSQLEKQKEDQYHYDRLFDLIDDEEYNSCKEHTDDVENEEDEDQEEVKNVEEKSSKDVNRETLQAQQYDRTFILNGPVIKVYQNAEESGFGNVYDHQRLQHCLDLPIVKNGDGNVITPSNLLLHNTESQLIFKNERNPSELFMFDLETGKIIQEINTGDQNISFNQITNETKNGQRDPERTLYGIERQGIHQIDPRIGGNSIVKSKTYKTDVNFSSVCPTMQGGFAIGSLNGELRMYKQVGQNAKTLLPGLGEPVRSVDISLDQKWILATCITYLLVVPTQVSSGQSGFDKSMGKEKPTPMKLTIDPKDIVKNQISNVNFTPARFNNGDNVNESSIVTSTGNLLVTWNFEKVKRGVLRSYKIKNLHQNAVDGQFQFNNEEKVLVTLPKTVKVETRKKQQRH